MSNYLAIATVTATLASIAREAMQAVPDISNVPDVRIARPLPDPNFVGAHLFLYRVAPNGFLRNEDLPTRNAEGRLIARPRFPADLEYLISFYGKEQEFEPQRLMGRVIATLQAEPLLVASRMRATIEQTPALSGSDLDRAPEPIRLVPLTLDLDQLARMWSVFYQVPYVASVAYACSAVWLDPDVTPRPSKPVSAIGTSVQPRIPVLAAVEPAVYVAGVDGDVRATGSGFDTSAPALVFDDVAVPAALAAGGALVATPPPQAVGRIQVRAGSTRLAQLSAPVQMTILPHVGSPVTFRPGFQAPPDPNVVPPTISVAVSVEPNARQTFEFLLTSTTTNEGASRPALITWLSLPYANVLDGGAVTSDLALALRESGVRVDLGDRVSVVQRGRAWRVRSAHQDVAIRNAGDLLVVTYGLARTANAMLACAVDGIPNGEYAVALRIDHGADATSRLLSGRQLFAFAAAAPPQAEAPLTGALRDAFAAGGVAFGPNALTRRPAPGEEWIVVDPDGPLRGRLVWHARQLTGFVLDPAAPVIAPLVTLRGQP